VAVVVGVAVAAAAAGPTKSVEHVMYKRPRNLCCTCEITFHISVLRRFFNGLLGLSNQGM
jgi:hypothetical protein